MRQYNVRALFGRIATDYAGFFPETKRGINASCLPWTASSTDWRFALLLTKGHRRWRTLLWSISAISGSRWNCTVTKDGETSHYSYTSCYGACEFTRCTTSLFKIIQKPWWNDKRREWTSIWERPFRRTSGNGTIGYPLPAGLQNINPQHKRTTPACMMPGSVLRLAFDLLFRGLVDKEQLTIDYVMDRVERLHNSH
jgi:hypothetical protein